MRLGVFARTAIVASALWTLGYSYHDASSRFDRAARIAQDAREVCEDTNRLDREAMRTSAIQDCAAEWTETYHLFSDDAWSEAFQGAIFYLGAAWLLFAISYGVVRWILAGRKNIRKTD